MSQHDQVIANNPGVGVRSDINAALAAIFSSSSGNVEPTVKVAGQLWFDTSVVGTSTLKVRNQANTAWITIGGSNVVANTVNIDPPTGTSAELILDKPSGTAGLMSRVVGSVNSVLRWGLRLGDATNESGSNVGSDFVIARYADSNSGTPIDTPLTIARSTGLVTANIAMPSVQGHRSGAGNVSLGTGTWTKVNITTVQINVGGWTLVSNNLVVPKTGIYMVGGSVSISAPASICSLLMGIGVNSPAAPTFDSRAQQLVASAGNWTLNCQRVQSLTAGDTLTLLGFSSVAGSSALDTIDTTFMWASLVAAQ